MYIKNINFSIGLIACMVLILFGFINLAPGQTPHREEITVIAPYEPTLPDVFKINIQPRIEPEPVSMPPVSFSITPRKINIKHITEPVQEANPPAERQKELFRNHIRGGFGNYTTPYFEFNAGSLRNPNYKINMQLRHLSSHGQIKEYGHSAFSNNLARFSARRFFDRATLGAEASYEHNVFHNYGFPAIDFPDTLFDTKKGQIRQRYNHAGAVISLISNNRDPEGFHYNSEIEYGFINNLEASSEHRISASGNVNRSYMLFRSNDKQSLGLKLDVNGLYLTDTTQNRNNTIVEAQPYLRFKYQEYELKAGINLAFDNDTSLHFRAFPAVEGRLQLVQNRLSIFAGVDGRIEINSLYSLATENPFIHAAHEYRNTRHRFIFYGGLHGSAGKRLDMKASVSNSISSDVLMFVNDTLAPYNRFNVIYDDMNIVQGSLSATFAMSKQLRISSGFNIFHYSPETEDRAWHKPSYRLFLEGWYNYSEQLAFRSSINSNGSAWAKVMDPDTGLYEEKELNPWVDISIGATYRFNEQLHFFLDARNLTAGQHFYWYNYPGQRLMIMAGAGFSF